MHPPHRPLRLGLTSLLALTALGMTGDRDDGVFATRAALGSDQTREELAAEDLIQGEYLVRFKPGKVGDLRVRAGRFERGDGALMRRIEGAELREAQPVLRGALRHDNGPARKLTNSFIVRSDRSLAEVRAQLEGQGDVESVEPRTHMRALALPNDTWYPVQWDMAQLDVEAIRAIGNGTGVTVAVVDSGVTGGGADSFDHLLQGWDFIGDDDDAADDDAMVSGLAHGTHVAGTIAQRTDNAEGVAGLAPGVGILPVRVLHYDDPSGAVWGDSVDIANGIIWAVDHGAQVINLSLGSPNRAEEVADACDYATENNVLLVAASGNDGTADGVLYPAALPNVIAVGSVGYLHNVAPYSNGGPQVDLVAPGGEVGEDRDNDGHADGIVQESITENGWRYVFEEGTSMATPHVAAAAALLFQHGWTTPEEVAEVLIATSDDIGDPGRDDASGYGQLNILSALAVPVDDVSLAEYGPVTISNVATDYSMDGRAWVSWNTDIASTTGLSGPNGDETDELPTHLHKVLVTGSPGFGSSVTVSSASLDGQSAEQTVQLTFPFAADSPFAGCNQDSSAVLLPGISAAALMWRRRRAARG